jgi:heme/copper-type cytochrome/quinol oxidase subunit 2
MAGEQRKLAHASKRDSTAMKTISLLGAVFLPGAYLASVFSMTFFNFQASDGTPQVSKEFWIYWVVTIPITIVIVGVWYVWEKKREARYDREDMDLEKGSEDMEKNIMAMMRKRTMSKASTWDTTKKQE